ncbi:MAG: hypothetical protein ACHQ2F_02535 [Desulfobaccales bacterium]
MLLQDLDVKEKVTTGGAVNKPTSDYSSIPQELKELRQWVVWKYGVDDKGRPTKHPYQPHKPQKKAKSNDPKTWNTFELTVKEAAKGFDGVGFVFSKTDPYTGVDLDKCRNAETGEIEPWALEIIARLNSYTEVSPSGRGVHILVKGKLPPGPRRKAQVEMYSEGRYFTMTGILP